VVPEPFMMYHAVSRLKQTILLKREQAIVICDHGAAPSRFLKAKMRSDTIPDTRQFRTQSRTILRTILDTHRIRPQIGILVPDLVGVQRFPELNRVVKPRQLSAGGSTR
jgi:hypothetical protein